MWIVILFVWLIGTLGFLVPMAKFFLKDMVSGDPDNGDYWMAALLALFSSWMWPLLVPGWWIVQMLKADK